MSDHFYKGILYPIQDKALALIGSISSPFYLTGGTAVSRLMLDHRFSDDLDFFLNRNSEFHVEADKLIKVLNAGFSKVEVPVRDDSYVKVFVYENAASLKIELVNDVGFRVGLPQTHKRGFQIDTWENILSNKLSALQRAAGKDFVDILFLCLNYNFNWETITNYAKQKDAWITEIAISKFLFGFDLQSLKEVKFPSDFDVKRIHVGHFEIMARDSCQGFDNSLYGKKI